MSDGKHYHDINGQQTPCYSVHRGSSNPEKIKEQGDNWRAGFESGREYERKQAAQRMVASVPMTPDELIRRTVAAKHVVSKSLTPPDRRLAMGLPLYSCSCGEWDSYDANFGRHLGEQVESARSAVHSNSSAPMTEPVPEGDIVTIEINQEQPEPKVETTETTETETETTETTEVTEKPADADEDE